MPRALVLWLLVVAAALAHHSTAPYDLIHLTTIAGDVTKFEWQNPHAQLAVDVTGENNEIEHWAIELENPHILGRLGWTKTSLQPGDHVVVTGGRAKDGTFRLRAQSVELPGGRRLATVP